MRIGFVYTNNPDWPKSLWVHHALERLGHEVHPVRSIDILKHADRECDLILFQHKNAGLNPNALIELAPLRRSVWAQWWFDLVFTEQDRPLHEQPMFRSNGSLMRCMDIVFVKEASEILQYRNEGVSAEYLDQGATQGLPQRGEGVIRWDFLLWGQGGHEYRQRAQDAMRLAKAGYRVAWACNEGVPNGIEHLPWTKPGSLPELCSQSRAVLCVDRRHDLDGYVSDRFWMAASMGCLIFKRFSPGFVDGPFVEYRNHDELLAQAASMFSSPGEHGHGSQCTRVDPNETSSPPVSDRTPGFSSNEIRQWALNNHSIEIRCQQMLESVRTVTVAASCSA